MAETHTRVDQVQELTVAPGARMLLTADTGSTFVLVPQKRAGALGVSIATHAAVIALLVIAARNAPDSVKAMLPDMPAYELTWLPIEGPGGGGGGGGNKSPEPPKKAELPGKDKMAVPVAEPPKVTPVEKPPEPEPKPDQQLTIPAKEIAAGETFIPGALEGTTASRSQGAGTGGGAGTGQGTGIGPGQGSGLGPGWGGGTGGRAYRPGSGVSMPRILREVKPQYTSDAMRAKIQGTVVLEAVVTPDGTVGNVEVIKSLDPTFGLDLEAIRAAKQWRFMPGMLKGQPVPVLVTIELTFTLR
jgi:protein TonB